MTFASTIATRQFISSDAETFRALRLRALADAPTAFASSVEEESAWPIDSFRDRIEAAPNAIFGAFLAGEAVGMAGFVALSGLKRRHRGLLWGVFVDGKHRGSGVARQLVGRVINHAVDHVQILEAGVTVGNDKAAALYASLGFEIFGVQPKALFVNGRFYDETLITLNLRPPVDG